MRLNSFCISHRHPADSSTSCMTFQKSLYLCYSNTGITRLQLQHSTSCSSKLPSTHPFQASPMVEHPGKGFSKLVTLSPIHSSPLHRMTVVTATWKGDDPSSITSPEVRSCHQHHSDKTMVTFSVDPSWTARSQMKKAEKKRISLKMGSEKKCYKTTLL